MNKIRGVLGIAVISHIYAYLMYGTKCGYYSWIVPLGLALTTLFMAGIWMCLNVISGKNQQKDGDND